VPARPLGNRASPRQLIPHAPPEWGLPPHQSSKFSVTSNRPPFSPHASQQWSRQRRSRLGSRSSAAEQDRRPHLAASHPYGWARLSSHSIRPAVAADPNPFPRNIIHSPIPKCPSRPPGWWPPGRRWRPARPSPGARERGRQLIEVTGIYPSMTSYTETKADSTPATGTWIVRSQPCSRSVQAAGSGAQSAGSPPGVDPHRGGGG